MRRNWIRSAVVAAVPVALAVGLWLFSVWWVDERGAIIGAVLPKYHS